MPWGASFLYSSWLHHAYRPRQRPAFAQSYGMAAIRFKREPARGIGKAWHRPIEIRRRPRAQMIVLDPLRKKKWPDVTLLTVLPRRSD
jgi:hypothetical protein